jgi:cell division cycle protein 20 (cofactor of APC complex)
MDYNSNYEVVNNINNFIRYNNRRIITPENNNKIYRKIQKTPLRILDAPNLVDDYYLNILDWGKENIIAVALSNEIYLWNNDNLQTSLLMTYENKDNDDMNNYITSLSWMNNGICVGVGLPNGAIQLWDINKKIKLREINAHEDRISCLSWNEYILSSGSRDRYIKNFDVRNRHAEISKIKKHKQEICSLKYSNEGDLLASGGNDNIAYIWDIRNLKNYFIFLNGNIYNNNYNEIKPYAVNSMHQAAIKAMSWCPWKRHILATGGGSKDQSIKI